MGVDSGGEVEESGLQPPDTLGKDGAGIDVPPLRQTVGVGQESLELFVRAAEVRGRVFPPGLMDVAAQMDETLLVETIHLVVGAEEIADQDALKRMA